MVISMGNGQMKPVTMTMSPMTTGMRQCMMTKDAMTPDILLMKDERAACILTMRDLRIPRHQSKKSFLRILRRNLSQKNLKRRLINHLKMISLTALKLGLFQKSILRVYSLKLFVHNDFIFRRTSNKVKREKTEKDAKDAVVKEEKKGSNWLKTKPIIKK